MLVLLHILCISSLLSMAIVVTWIDGKQRSMFLDVLTSLG